MPYRVMRLSFLPTLLVATACSTNNPAQPSSVGAGSSAATNNTASLTGSIAAPRPLTPANNAQIRNLDQPVTLTVQNAVGSRRR